MIRCEEHEVKIGVDTRNKAKAAAEVLTDTTMILRSVKKWLSECLDMPDADQNEYLAEALLFATMTPEGLAEEVEKRTKSGGRDV